MRRQSVLRGVFVSRFEDALGRFRRRSLTAEEAREQLGVMGRHFRRLCVRFNEKGADGLGDRRLGRASHYFLTPASVAWVFTRVATQYISSAYRNCHIKTRVFLRARVSAAVTRCRVPRTWVKTHATSVVRGECPHPLPPRPKQHIATNHWPMGLPSVGSITSYWVERLALVG